MKTLNLVKAMGVAIVATVLISACKSNVYPTIQLHAPEAGTEFLVGYDVHFVAMLSDSLGLKSYSIKITGDKGELYGNTWDLPEVKEMMLHHHEIFISGDTTPGFYTFTLSCTNTSKNESVVERGVSIVKF